jgi:hypothetical protein
MTTTTDESQGETMSEDSKAPRPREVAGRLAGKLLMPLVATTVSAAAGWAAKKAPEVFEERVLPRLRNATTGAGGIPERAKSAAGGAGDLASGLAERAKSAASGVVPWGEDGGDRPARSLSQDQLEKRRAERASNRADRRQNRSRR